MQSLGKSILNSAIGLSIFAVVTAGLIAVTETTTAARIADAERHARSKALLEIIPAAEHDNDLLEDQISVPADPLLGTTTATEGFVAKRNGVPTAVILTIVAPDGYSGSVRSIIGIDHNGVVKGVRVVAHQETPGLGDKVETRKSDWIYQFNGHSLGDPGKDQWKVKKDGGAFDQLTGATITPRAVVGSIRNALLYFQQHRDQLLPQPNNAGEHAGTSDTGSAPAPEQTPPTTGDNHG